MTKLLSVPYSAVQKELKKDRKKKAPTKRAKSKSSGRGLSRDFGKWVNFDSLVSFTHLPIYSLPILFTPSPLRP
ncbi:MAG: hypothetical protein DMG65_23610 [Candidatus Angelobacter sp. Gp1-AA117]|nr:MAG: hypothetical protein DMG65_23610 [Candidatus Angelobacter sp. Gp1-AA117]